MRTLSAVLLFGLALVSCSKSRNDSLPRAMREQDRFSRYAQEALQASQDTLTPVPDVYATALVFPDSVLWRKGDTRRPRLVLFRNGEPLGGISLGDRPDPERYRFQAGHVWTDSTDGHQTFIACDGARLFQYDGEERLQGFWADGGTVHTLGQRPGGGVCYRQNGQQIYASPVGVALGAPQDPDWEGGALTRDSSGVYYTIGLPVETDGNLLWEHRVMREGETLKMLPAVSGGHLFDVRVHGGVVYRLELRYGRYCLVRDEQLFPLDFPREPHNLKLTEVDGVIMAKGYEFLGREPRYFIQGADTTRYFYDHPSFPMYNLFVQRNTMYFVLMDHEDCVISVRRGAEELASFPLETYRLQTPRCIGLKKGVFALALTHDDGTDHLILAGEKQYPVRFNGYFTGIYIE